MNAFEVTGGKPLSGTITPQGAKNEALQVICACLLTDKKVTLNNLPDILDVNILLELVESLGATVEEHDAHSYSIQADNLDLDYMQTEAFRDKGTKLRGSIMLMGPLLARFGECYLPEPGGDKIGRRRLDTHLLGFKDLGAQFDFDRQNNLYTIKGKELEGTYLHLDEPSVTGTANIIMVAALTPGQTQIYNAACEPYIQQLCSLLVNMGAKIKGIGSNLLTIEGVEHLSGSEHTVLPDMIEVGSFIGLAAMTQSELTIQNCRVDQLGLIPSVFQQLGIDLTIQGDNIYVPAQSEYEISTFIDGSILTIYDAPWPGFTPDLLSVALVVATQAKGSVLIHQKMFESRLFFVDKLIDMGAQIILCDPHRATVIGLNRQHPLRGIPMSSPDIRAGIALLIAALSAEGTSTIYNIHQIDRGYEAIDERLRSLGADIQRI
jgi:UDP-N-acetylglucosamine 1-carboxyvinyltransferase